MYSRDNFSSQMLAKMSRLADECFYLKLNGRNILLDKSDSTMMRYYNGVGPDWKPQYLLPLIPHINDIFEPAGLLQDMHYALNSDRTIDSFHRVNLDFKKNCEKIVKCKHRWYDTRRFKLLASARLLYEASEKNGLDTWLKWSGTSK